MNTTPRCTNFKTFVPVQICEVARVPTKLWLKVFRSLNEGKRYSQFYSNKCKGSRTSLQYIHANWAKYKFLLNWNSDDVSKKRYRAALWKNLESYAVCMKKAAHVFKFKCSCSPLFAALESLEVLQLREMPVRWCQKIRKNRFRGPHEAWQICPKSDAVMCQLSYHGERDVTRWHLETVSMFRKL